MEKSKAVSLDDLLEDELIFIGQRYRWHSTAEMAKQHVGTIERSLDSNHAKIFWTEKGLYLSPSKFCEQVAKEIHETYVGKISGFEQGLIEDYDYDKRDPSSISNGEEDKQNDVVFSSHARAQQSESIKWTTLNRVANIWRKKRGLLQANQGKQKRKVPKECMEERTSITVVTTSMSDHTGPSYKDVSSNCVHDGSARLEPMVQNDVQSFPIPMEPFNINYVLDLYDTNGHVKIGASRLETVYGRLKTHRSHYPNVPIWVFYHPNAGEIETELKRHFESCRVKEGTSAKELFRIPAIRVVEFYTARHCVIIPTTVWENDKVKEYVDNGMNISTLSSPFIEPNNTLSAYNDMQNILLKAEPIESAPSIEQTTLQTLPFLEVLKTPLAKLNKDYKTEFCSYDDHIGNGTSTTFFVKQSECFLGPELGNRFIDKLRQYKAKYPHLALVGCVAWFTHPTILQFLSDEKIPCVFVVQKEDFLRPDLHTDSSRNRTLRQQYDAIIRQKLYMEEIFYSWDFDGGTYVAADHMPERLARSGHFPDDVFVDGTQCAFRCAGNINFDKSPAHPRVHHKFVVFLDDLKPIGVWTGSYNFTKTGDMSRENAIFLETDCRGYLEEFVYVYLRSEALDWTSQYSAPQYSMDGEGYHS